MTALIDLSTEELIELKKDLEYRTRNFIYRARLAGATEKQAHRDNQKSLKSVKEEIERRHVQLKLL